MSKFRKIMITVLLACLTVCVACAVAACKSMSPSFRNPGNIIEEGGDYKGKYVISVKSIGGLKLSNVTVTAKKNGEEVVKGISSEEGKIEFGLEAGEYELVVDESKLPNGYFVPSGTTYKTSPDKENAEIIISSKVISSTMTSGTKYALGDIMHNFSFMNSYGMQFTLEELLETKKAVVLNFWYTTCPACVSEFPALNNAYKAYADTISVVALDSQDTPEQIADFQNQKGLTFHCAKDNAGITSAFGVTAFPTTIIVDRYGVIAESHSGGIPQESTWKAIFNKYSSDDYTQDDPTQGGGNETETPAERTKFDGSIEMPASSVFAANVLGEGTEGRFDNFRPETNEKDAPYSWPWVIGEGGNYMTASNSKKPYSYAIVYADVKMETGDVLSYDYKVDTESEKDYLYALINGKIVGTHSGDSSTVTGNKDGWVKEYGVYVADHSTTVTLSFIYIKDPLLDSGTDSASIRNISITKISDSDVAIDQRVAATDGKTLNNGSFGINLKKNDDGYYYYVDENGGEYLLLANVVESTHWSEKHFGADSFTPAGESGNPYNASLYHISYWYMSNYKDDKKDSLLFNYLTKDGSSTLIRNYYMQQFSDNGLTPVTEELKDVIVKFTQAYAEEHKIAYYQDQWLEMCYYYRHYGLAHDLTGATDEKDNCNRYKDPIKGLTSTNAISLPMQTTKLEMTIEKTKIYKGEYYGGGLWYKLQVPSTGIYRFTTDAKNEESDPRIAVYDLDMNVIFDEYVDLRYDKFTRNVYDMSNVYKYQILQGNTTYYLQCDTRVPNETGTYDLKIERVDANSTYMIKVCTTSEGMWTYTDDGFIYYLAVPTVLGPDGYYYHQDGNKIGSKIYIDFVHGNFFDQKNHTLEWMINNKDSNGNYYFKENRARMQQFLKQSKQGKRQSDEDYGLLEASEELVNLLAGFIQNFSSDFASDGINTGAWKMFACYYEYYDL